MSVAHSSLRRRSDSAFTLVELLVVIAIIGVLVALLLPAIQAAREAARRSQCANNLRQTGLALQNFESARKVLPPSIVLATNAGEWGPQTRLLPYMEQEALRSLFDFSLPYSDPKNVGAIGIRVPTYMCPSESRDEQSFPHAGEAQYPINYGANFGVWLVYDPATQTGGAGMFYPNARLSMQHIPDGSSHTLAFSEVKAFQPNLKGGTPPATIPTAAQVAGFGTKFSAEGGHTEWVEGRAHHDGFTATFAPNSATKYVSDGQEYDIDYTSTQEGRSDVDATYSAVTSRSYHPGGVNAAMMDGSVTYVADSIELVAWQAAATRDGAEIASLRP